VRVSLIIQEQELSGCNKGEASKSVNKFQEGTWCYNPDGIEINYHDCKMVAIYANPEHVHFFVSRAPHMDEERLVDLVAIASSHFINENKLCIGNS
jgi:hypothetical protein